MNKALFLSLALAVLAPAAAGGEEIQVVVSGRSHDSLAAYRSDGRTFVSAKQAGELYGGQAYWYPISGRVQLSFRGRLLQLVIGSGEALLAGRKAALEAPPVLRSAEAFVPLSFFLGAEFTAFSGMESRFDEGNMLLTVERRGNLGSVHWFSYQEFTRVVLELKKPLGHAAAARGVQAVDLSLPFGVIDAPEQAVVGDGLVQSYTLSQDARGAHLSVRFARPGLGWRVREFSEPRRLAVEILAGAGDRVAAVPAPLALAPAAPALPAAQAVQAPPPPTSEASVPQRRRIVIDAGHGGKDPGALGGRRAREKDLNLTAALELAQVLREEKTFDVILTRGDDTFVPLAERSRMANDARADIFVSLHCNANRNRKEHGFEVYSVSENATDPEAARLAEAENASLELEGKSPADEEAALILRAMSKTENINASAELAALVSRDLGKRVDLTPRGVKQAAFYVLRGTDAPAILVEMGFVTNRRDQAKLGTQAYRRRLLDGVYAGLLDYAKRQGWLDPAQSRSKG